MEWLTKELLVLYGPLALGWIMFAVQWWDSRRERKEHRKEMNQLLEAYHTADTATCRVLDAVSAKSEDNARAMERLADAVLKARAR